MPNLVLIGPAVRPAIGNRQTNRHIAFYYVDNLIAVMGRSVPITEVCSLCLDTLALHVGPRCLCCAVTAVKWTSYAGFTLGMHAACMQPAYARMQVAYRRAQPAFVGSLLFTVVNNYSLVNSPWPTWPIGPSFVV